MNLDIKTALKAGVLYVTAVFAVGFVLGIARTVLLGAFPEVSRLAAVFIELPIILTIAWMVCGALLLHFALPWDIKTRLIMGLTAFVILLAAEASLSAAMWGLTLAQHVALYAQPSYFLGLLGQLVFAALPLLRHRRLDLADP